MLNKLLRIEDENIRTPGKPEVVSLLVANIGT